jgi:hypothetical protein
MGTERVLCGFDVVLMWLLSFSDLTGGGVGGGGGVEQVLALEEPLHVVHREGVAEVLVHTREALHHLTALRPSQRRVRPDPSGGNGACINPYKHTP